MTLLSVPCWVCSAWKWLANGIDFAGMKVVAGAYASLRFPEPSALEMLVASLANESVLGQQVSWESEIVSAALGTAIENAAVGSFGYPLTASPDLCPYHDRLDLCLTYDRP